MTESKASRTVITEDFVVSIIRRIVFLWLEMKSSGFDQTVLEIDGSLFKEPSKTVAKMHFIDNEDESVCNCEVITLDDRVDDPDIYPVILKQALDFVEQEHSALFPKSLETVH